MSPTSVPGKMMELFLLEVMLRPGEMRRQSETTNMVHQGQMVALNNGVMAFVGKGRATAIICLDL